MIKQLIVNLLIVTAVSMHGYEMIGPIAPSAAEQTAIDELKFGSSTFCEKNAG